MTTNGAINMQKAPMFLDKNTLASIFADTDMFCGKEDVIHAIIYHHLLESGLFPSQVAREQPVSTNRIDVVVFNEEIQGQFKNTYLLPMVAIEVKGGAYGNRNALNDEISSDGYCKDMDKLEKEVEKGITSWFICVDMPELGRAVTREGVNKIYSQCKKRKVSFAYFCQGEEHFFYAPAGEAESNERITINKNGGIEPGVKSILNTGNPDFNSMCEQLLKINGHEANTTAALYQLFRKTGLAASQISLETYFSFAKKSGSRMHDRPDLVLFDKDFDGTFNLYRKGNTELPNDSHKMAHINTILEVKGSAAMNLKSDKARLKIYLEDIAKIKGWQAMAGAHGCKALDGYFICLDGRKKSLPTTAVQEMFERSENNQVVYISNRGVEIST